jgi:hypothetical protein
VKRRRSRNFGNKRKRVYASVPGSSKVGGEGHSADCSAASQSFSTPVAPMRSKHCKIHPPSYNVLSLRSSEQQPANTYFPDGRDTWMTRFRASQHPVLQTVVQIS